MRIWRCKVTHGYKQLIAGLSESGKIEKGAPVFDQIIYVSEGTLIMKEKIEERAEFWDDVTVFFAANLWPNK